MTGLLDMTPYYMILFIPNQNSYLYIEFYSVDERAEYSAIFQEEKLLFLPLLLVTSVYYQNLEDGGKIFSPFYFYFLFQVFKLGAHTPPQPPPCITRV